MTTDELTKLAGVLAVFVSSVLGILTWRENQRKGTRETTQQRVDRESAERDSDLKRYDDGMWKRQEDMAKTIDRLETRVESLETRLQAEQVTTIQLRADLAVANGTIRDITAQNQRQGVELTRLRSQITVLQGKGYRGPVGDEDGGREA